MTMNTFAEKLTDLREKFDLSQKELGDFLSVSDKEIASYEAGISEPSFDKLVAIARYFEVSTDYLLGITSNAETKNILADADCRALQNKLNVMEEVYNKTIRNLTLQRNLLNETITKMLSDD